MLELTLTETLLRLLSAIAIGGLIGAERQYREKAAGLRTMTLICLGATLVTIFSQMFGGVRGDPGRVAVGIVTGIGFLGAGVILQNRGHIVGLTTAATIWLVAALGMGIGLGQYVISGMGAALSIIVLWMFPQIEFFASSHTNVFHSYEVTLEAGAETGWVSELCEAAGLKIASQSIAKKRGRIVWSWRAAGKTQAHKRLIDELLQDARVLDFHVLA